MISTSIHTSEGVKNFEFDFNLNKLFVEVKGFLYNYNKAIEESNNNNPDIGVIGSHKYLALKEVIGESVSKYTFGNPYFYNQFLDTIIEIIVSIVDDYKPIRTSVGDFVINIDGLEYGLNKRDVEKVLGQIDLYADEFVEVQYMYSINNISEDDNLDVSTEKEVTFILSMCALLLKKEGEVLPIDKPEKMRELINTRSDLFAKHISYSFALDLFAFFLKSYKPTKLGIPQHLEYYLTYIKAMLKESKKSKMIA